MRYNPDPVHPGLAAASPTLCRVAPRLPTGMLAAVAVGGLAIAHSTGQGQELTPGSSSSLLDTIALVPSPSPSPSPVAQAFSAKVTTPATSECDERCRTIWGLGAYGDWDRKCT